MRAVPNHPPPDGSSSVSRGLANHRRAELIAATVNEIYDGLIAGGYQFDAKDALNAKRGLRISLTKNSSTFYRVPNGRYGLLVWYPNAKAQSTAARAAKNGSKAETAPPEDSAHEQDDETGEKQTTDEGGAQSSAA